LIRGLTYQYIIDKRLDLSITDNNIAEGVTEGDNDDEEGNFEEGGRF
jgi:hypothetical protein